MNHKKIIKTLLITQGGSLVGSRMTSIAIGIWLFQSTGKASYLLLIPFFNEIPALLFGHLTGVLLDKWHKKKALIIGDVGQAIGSVVLLISVLTVGFNPVVLYVVVAIQGVFSALQTVAADATTSILVENEHLDKINAYKEMLFPIASFLGPALTGVLYPFVGLIGIMLVDLITFVIAVTVVGLLNFDDIEKMRSETNLSEHTVRSEELAFIKDETAQITKREKNEFIQSLKLGYGYFKKNTGLLYLVIYIGIINILLNGPLELIIPYALSLSGDERFVSLLMSMMGIATFFGSIILSLGKHSGKRISRILILFSITGIMMVFFGISRTKLALMATLFFVMLPLPMTNALFKSLLQNSVPMKIQGRVFSIAYQIAYGLAPVSFIVVGPLVDSWLEPLLLSSSNHWLDVVFGHNQGAGMGVVLSFAGGLIILASIIASVIKKLTGLEKS